MFVVIGAQKAGTTWLHTNLRIHDELWLPWEKELHYFDEKRDDRSSLLRRARRDRRWRRQFKHQVRMLRKDFSTEHLRWSARYLTRRPDDEWYLSLFEPGARAGLVTGEITPNYSALPGDRVAVAKRLLPDAKIVFLMRHPVERAWSAAMMGVLRGRRGLERVKARREAPTTTESALLEHAHEQGSVERTDYVRALDNWSAHYDADRIFVGFLEDIHFQPASLLAAVCSFLGVSDRDDWPALRTRVYSGSADTISSSFASRLAAHYDPLVSELQSRIGSYASWWRFANDRLLEGVSEPLLPYPFYESDMWAEWLARREIELDDRGLPRLQSATLAEIRARNA
jgi:hypothetical protein